MDKTLLAISALLFISKLGLSYGGVTNEVKKSIISNSDNLSNKKARDIISSFLNAWKTSKIIPEYGRESMAVGRSPSLHVHTKQSPFQLDKLDFLGQRKSHLDGPALYALRNALNPKPIKKQRSRPTNPEAQTFFGKEMNEEAETSPELKLASFVSKPIYHTLPGGAPSSTEDDIKQFMFGNNNEMNENHVGLPSDDWQSTINKRRNLVQIPGVRERNTFVNEAADTAYTGRNGNKRNEIIDKRVLDKVLRKLRDEIPVQERELIDQQQLRNMFRENGEKKELITDPYDALSLPVSEFLGGQDIDRKFYKSLPQGLLDEYETSGKIPAQFKLQKNHLWGNIQKRWRRSKINKHHHPRYSPQEDTQERAIGRSFSDGLGETGHTFDAYGQIGQQMEQPSSLMGLNNEKVNQPCGNNQELKMDPIAMHNRDSTPEMFVDGAGVQDPSKQVDGGIIQISPDGTPARSRIARPRYDALTARILRNKRSALILKRKTLQDALARRVKAAKESKLALSNKGSTAASRSISGHYMGGNPDSRGTESEDGITEDNEHANLEERMSHDSTPLLMKIAQGDRDDMHKYWSNKHSPGNGFYTGHGEGPNHPYLGDYFGHGPDEMLHDDGIKSLEESASPEDHHTASLIDSIWEHDLGEGHLGEHHLERHHGGLKIKNYFGGHHSQGIMLPTETLDGIDTHWTGHLPHVHSSEYSHTEGHPVEFSPARIKAIQAIQDDPAIDAEIAPHDGIGIAMSHGHHSPHGYHHGEGHAYGGMNLGPVVGDPVGTEDSKEEEYKQHIDNLLTQYHGLEEHLRGTDGTLAGHMDPAAFAHHGSHHLHTGYDMYAYKNPWENMKIPYHVPVVNHPQGEEAEPPPSPLTFEGKTDEKGAPTDEKGAPIEGGKEEGGKGGPMVEGSKANADKASKGKEGELPKGAKAGGGKMPVIPKQRGGPELSTGKNETENATKEKESKGSEDKKETKEEDKGKKATSVESDEKEKKEGKEEKINAKENQTKTSKESKEKESSKETEGNEKVENEESGNLSNLVASMMNSTGKQSEMLNNLKTALGDEAKNPKSVAALQLAKLKQLGSMQQALLTSLAKQATKKPTESQSDAEGGGVSEIKQLLELQQLQQLGAGIKANSLVNTLRQNSLLQSLKAAQENILKNFKTHAALLDNGSNEKQEATANPSPEIQKFFGKLPVKLLGSDLGNVGSEKVASRSHPSNSIDNEANIGDLIHTLNTVHAKKHVTSTNEASIKPMLSNLLSESLLKTMKNKLKHSSRSNLAKESKEGNQSDKAYSTIGNEGPASASEDEAAHTRSPHFKEKKKSKGAAKHKKLNEDRELNTQAVEKAEIAPFHEKEIDEDAVSKKDQIKPKHKLDD